jgi:dolichol-phosphate mannosyltransferase
MVPFLLYLAYNLILYLFFDVSMVQGWPSLILAITLFGSFILVMLGILGEYVGRVYGEVKRRPLYLIREVSAGSEMARCEPNGNDERIP